MQAEDKPAGIVRRGPPNIPLPPTREHTKTDWNGREFYTADPAMVERIRDTYMPNPPNKPVKVLKRTMAGDIIAHFLNSLQSEHNLSEFFHHETLRADEVMT